MKPRDLRERLDRDELQAFSADAKIALLATLSHEGLPHVTLLTSLQGNDAETLVFGQFTQGRSKEHLRARPHAAFCVLTADRRVWTGTARWRTSRTSGSEYETYNRKPMFRYNAYSGVHTVHYLDLVGVEGPARVSRARLGLSHLGNATLAPRWAAHTGFPSINAWTRGLLEQASTLKFFAWAGTDGYPGLFGPLACVPADGSRLVFPVSSVLAGALRKGSQTAVFAINPKMQSVLVRGGFLGWRRHLGLRAGCLEVEWVYNSMPPKQGQIYPTNELRGARLDQAATVPRPA